MKVNDTFDRITAAFHAADRAARKKGKNARMSVSAIAREAGVHRSLLYKSQYAGISKLIADRRRGMAKTDREALLAAKSKQLMQHVAEQRNLIEALGRQCALLKVALATTVRTKDRQIARLKRDNGALANQNADLIKKLRRVTRLQIV